jgi:hypothetical protein
MKAILRFLAKEARTPSERSKWAEFKGSKRRLGGVTNSIWPRIGAKYFADLALTG